MDEHHRDLSPTKWGASNKVLVGRPAASPIGQFLLLYGSLFVLMGLLSPAMEQLIWSQLKKRQQPMSNGMEKK
jgi:hypothetical protein